MGVRLRSRPSEPDGQPASVRASERASGRGECRNRNVPRGILDDGTDRLSLFNYVFREVTSTPGLTYPSVRYAAHLTPFAIGRCLFL